MDFLEKLTRIIFTIVLGSMVAVAGLKVQWDKIGIETDTLCFNQYKVVAEMVSQAEVIQASLVRRYAERCEISIEAASEDLNNARAAVEMASADGAGTPILPAEPQPVITGARVPDPNPVWPDAPPPTTGTDLPPVAVAMPEGAGHVALGRAQTDTFAQVNFDRIDGRPATGDGSAPAAGDILRARWEVNLRSNTEATTKGTNPIVGLVTKSDCVRVLTIPENLRGQFWALVERTACPA